MKTKFLIYVLFALGFFRTTYAQNNAKWAVGPDLLGLFGKNVLPKYSLFSRYKVGDKGAIRLRVGWYDVKMQPGIFDVVEQRTNGVRIGYERIKPIYKQSLFMLYGAEYIYYSDHAYFFDYNNPTTPQSLLITDYIDKGVGAFIGCRYFPIPNLSVSTESTFQITKSRIIKARLGVDEYYYNFTSTLLIPITSFNVCFHF